MALVWRLSSPAFADVLDGAGNRVYGARWNSPGRGVVYTGSNLSLCVLETYVHFPPVQREAIPDFAAISIRVPDDAGRTQVSADEMQRLLSGPEPEQACREAGDRWLESGADLLLVAPSVVVPEDSNIMINPAHPRMRDVAIVYRREFRFDPRLVIARA
jgi:RES domain-containing protein